MTAVVISASLETDWVRPLAALRTRGVACVVVTLDPVAYAGVADSERSASDAKRARALRHALAEYELRTVAIAPGQALAEALA